MQRERKSIQFLSSISILRAYLFIWMQLDWFYIYMKVGNVIA